MTTDDIERYDEIDALREALKEVQGERDKLVLGLNRFSGMCLSFLEGSLDPGISEDKPLWLYVYEELMIIRSSIGRTRE